MIQDRSRSSVHSVPSHDLQTRRNTVLPVAPVFLLALTIFFICRNKGVYEGWVATENMRSVIKGIYLVCVCVSVEETQV
jgi:hypothetical protein